MNAEGEVELLRFHLTICERLASSLTRAMSRVKRLMPIAKASVLSLSDDEHVDVLAFLKTFEQFEEALGRTLKIIALLMSFGKVERLTARDVANRAQSLGVIGDGRAWANAVRTRNELAHEYPLEPEKQANQINKAWIEAHTLFATQLEIINFVERERLFDAEL